LGLNSILKASVKEPVEMYLNDFDNNGTIDQIICSYQNGISYPVASLDQLLSQISGLEKKFTDYHSFGGKTAKDIFGWKTLSESVLKKAEMFESCLFLNDGKGVFTISKLPPEAQFSTVRDILAHDLDNDGKIDILLVGNDYTSKPSYGRQDASYGLCLMNEGTEFVPLRPGDSGFRVMGDARKISIMQSVEKQYVVVGVNDEDMQVFEQKK
ncbi:MAG TPA: VCBS repeat-containing protein, partial [Bacteroidales bacterium]|nr:VCBS repeat-containing protein [Bacteroidales bacterium]